MPMLPRRLEITCWCGMAILGSKTPLFTGRSIPCRPKVAPSLGDIAGGLPWQRFTNQTSGRSARSQGYMIVTLFEVGTEAQPTVHDFPAFLR